jgi:hypothetical protein
MAHPGLEPKPYCLERNRSTVFAADTYRTTRLIDLLTSRSDIYTGGRLLIVESCLKTTCSYFAGWKHPLAEIVCRITAMLLS